jgi:hypothetical protein
MDNRLMFRVHCLSTAELGGLPAILRFTGPADGFRGHRGTQGLKHGEGFDQTLGILCVCEGSAPLALLGEQALITAPRVVCEGHGSREASGGDRNRGGGASKKAPKGCKLPV